MRTTHSFLSTGPTVFGTAPAGGTAAMANPAASAGQNPPTQAQALLLANCGGAIASVRFAENASYAPQPLSPDLADIILNPEGEVVICDPDRLAAPYVITTGYIGLTPGSVWRAVHTDS